MTSSSPSRPDARVGELRRIRPSGYVHRIAWIHPHGLVGGADLAVFDCGTERRFIALTADFPPGARRCPVCFVQEADRG